MGISPDETSIAAKVQTAARPAAVPTASSAKVSAKQRRAPNGEAEAESMGGSVLTAALPVASPETSLVVCASHDAVASKYTPLSPSSSAAKKSPATTGAASCSGVRGPEPLVFAVLVVDGRDREARHLLELDRAVGLAGDRQHEPTVDDDLVPVGNDRHEPLVARLKHEAAQRHELIAETLNATAKTECGSIRRKPWTAALGHAAAAVDVVAPAPGSSRWSVVSYSGSTIGGENATRSIRFFAVRMLTPIALISCIDM